MMWFWLVVLGIVLSAVAHEGDNPSFNVDDLFPPLEDPWGGSVCPLINNEKYFQKLASYVARQQPVNSLVVVGPKSSGKSKGISRMIVEWKKLGYTVLNIDLKGSDYNVSDKQVLGRVSKEVYKVVEGADFNCLSEHVHQNCSGARSEGYFEWIIKKLFKYIPTTLLEPLVTTTTGIGGISIFHYLLRKKSLTIVIIIIFFGFIYFAQSSVREFFEPLYDAISSGDWEILRCTCNGIAMCKPDHRPILIVREFVNFNNESLEKLLRSLEPMKQEQIMFPVILETSDFLWLNKKPVKNSMYSFDTYFLEEMTFSEGVKHVVNRYNMWKLEEFEKIYEALGGHIGSYAMLWTKIKDGNTVDGAINMLKTRAYDSLLDCMHHTSVKDLPSTKSFFCKLREASYKLLDSQVLLNPVSYLLNCNILFQEGPFVYPQNRLLQHGIEKYLEDFTNNCSNVTFV